VVPCADPGGHVIALDFADVRGQAPAIEALITAIAARERGVLFVAPPGAGGAMLARRVTTLFPPLSDHERVWLRAEVDGVQGEYPQRITIDARPFRAPHYGSSISGIVGVRGHAGELHLARFGALMLHEIDEFLTEAVRRLGGELEQMFGAPFVIAIARPCPCGWHGFAPQRCYCSELPRGAHVLRVQKMIQFLGITTTINVPPQSLDELRNLPPGESSESLRARIEAMRAQGATKSAGE